MCSNSCSPGVSLQAVQPSSLELDGMARAFHRVSHSGMLNSKKRRLDRTNSAPRCRDWTTPQQEGPNQVNTLDDWILPEKRLKTRTPPWNKKATASQNCWYAWQTAMYLLNTYLCQQSLEAGLRSSVARFPLPATRRQLHLQSIAVEAERALVVAAAISAASHKQRRGGANTEDAIISTSFSHDYGQEQSMSA